MTSTRQRDEPTDPDPLADPPRGGPAPTTWLFDANAMAGRIATGPCAEDAAALVRELDRLGIASALVTHTHAWRHDVARGNELVLAETRTQPRLRPCWMVLPDTCGEVPA